MTTRPGFSFCICPDGKLLRQQVEELLGAHPDAGRERHVFWGDDELPPKLIIDVDHFMERSYLDGLAAALKIAPEEKAALDSEVEENKRTAIEPS